MSENIPLSTTSVTIQDLVCTYWVMTPNTSDFMIVTTNRYTLANSTGRYRFEVDIESALYFLIVLTIGAADVWGTEAPEPVTVTVNIKDTGWKQVAIRSWNNEIPGNFVLPEQIEAGIYRHVFADRIRRASLIFVDSDGSLWPNDRGYITRLGRQSVTGENITGKNVLLLANRLSRPRRIMQNVR